MSIRTVYGKSGKQRVKRIHVNRQRIAQNLRNGTKHPVITMKIGDQNIYGHEMKILGSSTIVNAEMCGKKPLSCGARVYIETTENVLVDGVLYV